jgi:hypothetical protein
MEKLTELQKSLKFKYEESQRTIKRVQRLREVGNLLKEEEIKAYDILFSNEFNCIISEKTQKEKNTHIGIYIGLGEKYIVLFEDSEDFVEYSTTDPVKAAKEFIKLLKIHTNK